MPASADLGTARYDAQKSESAFGADTLQFANSAPKEWRLFMMKCVVITVAAFGLVCAIAGPLRAEESAPASAKTLLAEGQQKAAKQRKRVLVMFHSTW